MGAIFGIAGSYTETDIAKMQSMLSARSEHPGHVAPFNGGCIGCMPTEAGTSPVFTSTDTAAVAIDGYLDKNLSPATLLHPEKNPVSGGGLYAAARFDARSGTLTVWRDPSGARPLYWTRTASRLIFASDPAALLALDDVPRELNPDGVVMYAAMICPADPVTIYRSIHMLRPGHMLTAENNEHRVRRIWDPPWAPPDTPSDPHRLAIDLREAMEDAVADALPKSLDHTGFFLSGGTDTGGVVALAAGMAQEPINTFTIGYEGTGSGYEDYNEFEYARLIAEHYGTRHHEAVISPESVKKSLPGIIAGMHQPSGDAINTYLVSGTLPETIRVVLTGTGGDEIFIGSHWYKQQARLIELHNRWQSIPGMLRALLLSVSGILPRRFGRRLQRLDALKAGVPAQYRHFKFLFSAPDRQLLFSRDFQGTLSGDITPENQIDAYDSLQENTDAVNRMEALLFQHEVSNLQLRDVDSMAHAHGIEARSPLVDRRILDVLCRAPGDVKAPGGQLRHLMFQALGDRLLEKTKTRRKMSFIVPMDLWARRDLRKVIEPVLAPDVIRRRGIFNPDAVEAVKAAFYTTGRERHPFKVWNLALFELWCRFHLDAPVGSGVPETVEDLL